MKWLGQYIVSLIARFKHDVYLEDLRDTTETDMLVVDSSGKISKRPIDAIDIDVSDFMSGGSSTRVVTATGTDAMQANQYLTFNNTLNVSSLVIFSNQDDGDHCSIRTTTHGASTITTIDDDAAAAHFEIDADGDITLDSTGDIKLEAGGGDVTCDADTFTIKSETAQKPKIDIRNSVNDSDGSRFIFTKARGGAGQDNDLISAIQFQSYNDAGTPELQTYGQILGNIHDATDGQESGIIEMQVASHDGGNTLGLKIQGGSVDEEVDVFIASGAESVTSVAGHLNVAGDLNVTGNINKTGKQYRIINTSFRDDIVDSPTKHYVPIKSVDEQINLTRADACGELAVCDGRLVSATVRVESMGGTTGDFTLTMGVETNVVGSSYTGFSVIETEAITANTADDHHIYHFVFDEAKHWDSTDMFAVSIESSSDEWETNERFFVTLVVEDDWSTYLAGSSREIDTTP